MIISMFQMKRIELISFDAEGTVVTPDFSQTIWHEAIPALYAQKQGLDFAQAKRQILKEYGRIGDQRLTGKVNSMRLRELGETAADTYVSACPTCKKALSGLQLRDISELVAEHLVSE